MAMKLKIIAALAASVSFASVAQAAVTYNFVVAPILGINGLPLADDNGRVDGRTFVFSIAADERPRVTSLPGPQYFAKSYTWYEFGSTTPVVMPAISGRNVTFHDAISQGGMSFISGTRNFRVLGDDASEVLYDEAAYLAALAAKGPSDPQPQPIFKLGTFTLSTYPRNGANRPQPIQNYTVTISEAAVGDVPEPASWGMMVLGFGVAGAAVRRSKAKVRFA
jgi:hypothetical protein